MAIGSKWEAISAAKRNALSASIPPEWLIPEKVFPSHLQHDVTEWPRESGWFTAAELEITESTAPQILEKTLSGIWTAESVTGAFCKRAAAAQQLVILPTFLRWFIILIVQDNPD